MEEKETYTLQELYDDLPCTLKDLGKMAGLNEVTVARIRDGESTRRSTANKLLRAISKVYGRPDNRTLTLRHVTGINVQRNLREEQKEAKKETLEDMGEQKGAA